MSNKERILEKAAEIKAVLDRYQAVKEANEKTLKRKQEEGTLVWRTLRSGLIEIDELGGFREAGYETWSQFCQERFGTRAQSIYSEELTRGLFEKVVFEVPICTFNHNFFSQSRCYPGGFKIRRSNGEGNWRFVPEEIEKAKAAWEIAKEIAAENDRALPDRNDMGLAVAKVLGGEYEPKLFPIAQLRLAIQRLEEDLAKSQQMVVTLEEELADLREAQINADIGAFRSKQKDVFSRIQLHCGSPIQFQQAIGLLLTHGTEEAEKYLLKLIANKYKGGRQAA